MKKLISAFLLCVVVIAANAQNTRAVVQVDANSVVRDSSGIVYPAIIWQKMWASGEYKIRLLNANADRPEFLIARLSEAELDARFSKMPLPTKSENFKEGQQITSFSASDIEGKKLKLKDMAGKVVVINFWFIGCPPCRMELPALNDLSVKYANEPDVVFIAFALDGERDLRDFLKIHRLGYRIVSDGRDYANLYRIHLYPTNLVLDKEGKVMFSSVGYAANTPYLIKKNIEAAKQKTL